MTLDDLKNINVNDPSSWPLPVKISGIVSICVAILAAGYFVFVQGMQDEYENARKSEVQLREDYLAKKEKAINLAAYKQQMEEMQQTFGSLVRQLPNTTEIPDLLVDITQAGLGRGLEFVLFKPEREQPRDFYAELPISLELRGTYHELAQFVSDVSALPRIVTFGDIAIAGESKGAKLKLTAKAKTYRYLEGGAPAKPPQARSGK